MDRTRHVDEMELKWARIELNCINREREGQNDEIAPTCTALWCHL